MSDEKHVTITREEFSLLRSTSKHAETLAGHNVRLQVELETCREASARVEGLEKENKRLAQELQEKMHQVTPMRFPGHLFPVTDLKTTPASSDTPPPPSFQRIEPDERKQVTKDQYDRLIIKYNRLQETYLGLKEKYHKYEAELRSEKQKGREWLEWSTKTSKTLAKKTETVRRQEEEIRKLRALLNEGRGSADGALVSDIAPLEGQIRKGALLIPDNDQIQVPASSPPKRTIPGAITGDDTPDSPIFKDVPEAVVDHVESGLPPFKDAGVADTEFEPLEVHHTSSTEADSDPISPKGAPEGIKEITLPIGTDYVARATDEVPEVVSSRSVNKRKRHQSGTEQTPITRIKIEILSSSPLASPMGLAALGYLNANESMDLDDIGEKVDTPRKQRARVLQLSRQNSAIVTPPTTRILRGSHSQSNITTGSTTDNDTQDTPVRRPALQPRTTNKQILPRTSVDRASKKRRIASDNDLGNLIEDGSIEPGSRRRQPSDTAALLSSLLSKPSPPKHALSPLPNPRAAHASPRPGTSNLVHEVNRLDQVQQLHTIRKSVRSKESTPQPRQSETRKSRSREPEHALFKFSAQAPQQASRPSISSTLRRSIEPPLPSSRTSVSSSREPTITSERPLTRSPTPVLTQLPPQRDMKSFFDPNNPARASPAVTTPAARVSAAAKRPRTTRKRHAPTEADYEMNPEQEPLRSRPVATLSMQDFKVNPNYNQGYNFAFKEVVRGAEARACLQGCTKPDCCGYKFRALVTLNRNPDALTMSQEEEDKRLLDEYLGDSAYKVRNMSKAEREEMIIQARTRDMANKSGKHRHSYERRASPPGFWRTDFPTTQEELEDREKAKEKEKQDVLSRYQQAMRPGGAYMFRDE